MKNLKPYLKVIFAYICTVALAYLMFNLLQKAPYANLYYKEVLFIFQVVLCTLLCTRQNVASLFLYFALTLVTSYVFEYVGLNSNFAEILQNQCYLVLIIIVGKQLFCSKN